MIRENENSCVICYETFNQEAFGSTVPCGHLFHRKCFDSWIASRSNRRDLKCPMCNSICNDTTPFVRIFLNLDSLQQADDDISFSSDEEEEEDHGASPLESQSAKAPEINKESTEITEISMKDPEIIEILDDDDNTRIQSEDKQNKEIDDESKYKKKAKKLKQRVKQLEKQREQMAEEIKEKHVLEEELEETETLLDDSKSNALEYCRRLEVVRIALSRATKENEFLRQKNTEFIKESRVATESLKKLQASYNGELQKAQINSMTEVNELTENNRELSSDNQRLKEAILKHKSDNKQLLHRNKILEKRLSLEVEESMKDFENDRRDNQKKTVKAFREIHCNRQRMEEKATERNNIQKRLKPAATANAARMCRHAERKLSAKSSSTATAILDNLDLTAKRRKIQLNVQRPKKSSSEDRKKSWKNVSSE
eukprot:CAMPEP_0178918076 /NCGR_PEP_ID=MMETSP0786-20121207/13621_1 /TAXON_ID=186022 /ORGANISM="Thalassionema frauenfeldii, Strain CCMP 1798" /LENGTH=426 /DNA_ID=CAMNT_0020591737 /DNA_START=44 /DNA_END=1324 /DNA_ORIENTATION=-